MTNQHKSQNFSFFDSSKTIFRAEYQIFIYKLIIVITTKITLKITTIIIIIISS